MTNVYTSLIVRRSSVVCSAAILTLLITAPALAGPTGGERVQGTVTIQNVSDTLTNIAQTSDRAVINWQGFSVDVDETVNFQQPNSDAAILNRVVGSNMSEIAGQIFANGHVYLINPNGMVFSGTSYVDVNGFVATTANVADNVFMSGGQMTFDTPGQSGATITIEEGAQILAGGTTAEEAGLVAMIAPGIEHSGIIQASFGQVFIGGAETFTMDLNGDGLYGFALGDAVSGMPANGSVIDITSTGSIVAQGGAVLIAAEVASDIVGNAINLSGQIFARSADMDGQGNVVLKARCGDGSTGCGDVALVDGSLIDVTGDSAGDVTISGRGVTVASAAEVNARGTQGGGSISIESNGSGASDALTMSGNLFADGGMGNAGSVTLTALNGSDLNATHANDFGFISATGTDGTGSVTFAGGNDDGMGGADGDYSVSTIVATSGSVDYDYNGGNDLTIGTAASVGNPFIHVDSLNSALRNGNLSHGANTLVNVDGALIINGLIDGRDKTNSAAASGALSIDAVGDVSIAGTCDANPCGIIVVDSDLTIKSGKGIFMSPAAGQQYAPSLLSAGKGDISLEANGNIITRDLVSSGTIRIDAKNNGSIVLESDLGGTQDAGDIRIGSLLINDRVTDEMKGDVTIRGIRASGSVKVSRSSMLNVDGQIESIGEVNLSGDTIHLRRSIFTEGGHIIISAGSGGEVFIEPTGKTDVTNTIGSNPCPDPAGGCTEEEALANDIDAILPAREVTLSTGTGGGDIRISGVVDIPPAWRDVPIDYNNGTLSDVPLTAFVVLNVDAGAGTITFADGIASGTLAQTFLTALIDIQGVHEFDGVFVGPCPYTGCFYAVNDDDQWESTNILDLIVRSGTLDVSGNSVVSGNGVNAPLVVNSLIIEPGATLTGEIFATVNNSIVNPDNDNTPNIYVVMREVLHVPFADDNPPTPSPNHNFSGGIDGTVGSNPSPGVPSNNNVPGGPGGGSPGGVDPRSAPDIPTGTAPDAIDDLSRAGNEDEEDSGDADVNVGGAGVASEADLGNDSLNDGAATDVFAKEHHVVAGDDCVQSDEDDNCVESSKDNEYLSQGVFESVQSSALQ